MPQEKPSVREWLIEDQFDEDGNLVASLSDQLAYRLARLAVVVADIGGVIAVGSDREEIAPGQFHTVRAFVRWESFAPARRLPREAPPEPESVPEPEAEVFDQEHDEEPVPIEA